jgi:chemosensory pili system protein ChpA (sensor histidine kinase/response regulator)
MAEPARVGPASQLSSQTLDAVAREINISLGEARVALEAFVEATENAQLLQRCRNELAQVQGVLRALEIHGAALLAEEMHQVCIYLEATLASKKNQNEALDALMRAIVQLPTYLDRVLAGGRDMALVLLPLLNDMRAVRGSPLLSEGTLLSLNLKSDRGAEPQAPAPGEEALTVANWARKLRTQFQSGMVGWIRGERVEQHLDTLASVASRFEKIATTQALFQLWWVAGAVIEGLRERGLDGGVSVKRLLGLADREIKRLYEQGEPRYASHPPVELLNNLLYYVARSSNSGPRVAAVRESFRLGELLPVDESVEQERENLSAPSIKLMQTVGAAIREDLAKVKDVLDIFVRRGGAAPEELGPQVELLRKIGDTLGVLGLGEQRSRVQAEITKLEALVATQEKPSESALIDIAATLIQIEDRLDDDLVGKILPRGPADGSGTLVDPDFQQVQAAVLRECVVNLARVKEYVAQQVGGNLDTAGFDAWQDLMRGIQSGLAMLGKTRAEAAVTRITAHLRRIMQSGGGPAAMAGLGLDRLADAIVSVEYYMETLQAGRTDPWYMLDNAESALAAVDAQPSIEDTAAVKLNTGTDVLDRRTYTPPAPPVAQPVAAFAASSDDPELITVFLEEAREEAEKIRQELPAWDQDPALDDSLSTARRAFHTLKGSGRVVGATALAEFAWSIENLMNRLLDRTQTRSPAILAVLRESVDAVPQLIEQLESGKAPTADVLGIAARAHLLAAGKPLDGGAPAAMTSSTTQFAMPSLAVPVPEPEPSLSDIYARETDSHVNMVRAWLAKLDGQPGPHLLPESVYRASHTLSGSSKTAGARHGVRLAEPLNHWLRKSFDNSIGVSADDLVLIGDCMTAMESVSRNLRENTGFFATHDALLERIAQAEAQLDQRIAAYSNASNASTPAVPLPPVVVAPVVPAPAQPLEEKPVMAQPQASVSPAPPPPPQPVSDESDGADVDYDPEVAAIFSEEATELLEACQSSFQGIGLTAPRKEEFAALKRPLHTLKGGARMAGVKSMGDLGHELESLIIGIEIGNVSPSQEAREALQRSLDELGRMRDLLAANQPVPNARRLLAQVRALTGNMVANPDTMPSLPVLTAPPQDTMPEVAAIAAPALEPEMPEPEAGPAPEPVAEPVAASEPESALEPHSEAPAAAPEAEPWFEPVRDILEVDLQAEPEPEAAAPAQPIEEPVAAFAPPPLPSNVIELPRIEPARPPPAEVAPESTAFPPPAPSRPPAFARLMAAAAVPPGREPTPPSQPAEMARVDAELLNQLLNQAGEVSIARARVEQQLASTEFNLAELSRTVTRLREQLAKLEMETEAQILHRHESETGNTRTDFDPLELDRYSSIQQFSRALAETANDVASIQALLENLTRDTQTQLQLQGRTIVEMQNGLMRTRMVSFQRHVQRLSRIVRQTAVDEEKKAELIVEGASGELDRQVLERMLPPFEHLLRNAVVHGIEKPEARHAAGKSDTGQIRLQLRREGAEVIVDVRDDGAGMNVERIRSKALSLGLIAEGQALSDEEAMQLILEPGFSTAENLTQAAGRGVGMDVVANEVKKLGGSLLMETTAGKGSRFMIRLPLSLSVGHAVILRVGDEQYALPMPTIEGVVRIPREELQQHLLQPEPSYLYGGYKYRLQHLANFVGLEAGPLPEEEPTLPVVLVRAGELSTGVVAEEMLGTREIVVKPVGPQIAGIRGVSGATILGDGRIVVILDMGQLVRAGWRGRKEGSAAREALDRRIVALVVDDSITVRRVTQRLLERNGMRVLTARDGQDALAVMEENIPDVVLLDIEMPRMDGYQVAEQMRSDPRLKHVPIIMITSRVGEKHRARAMEIGVDEYLGKPYQESQLLEAIVPLVDRTRASRIAGA